MAACHKDIKTGKTMGKYQDKQPTFEGKYQDKQPTHKPWFKKKGGAIRYIQRRPNGTITTCYWDPDHLVRISIKNVGADFGARYYGGIAIFCFFGLEWVMFCYCVGPKFPFTVTRESQVSRAAFTFTVNHM